MLKLRHPNVLQIMDVVCEDPIAIVMPWMRKGDLAAVLKAEPDLPWDRRLSMLAGAARGLAYVHKRKVLLKLLSDMVSVRNT
jgi:serine/threonine protein kinase